MKIFMISLVLVMCCCNVCLGEEAYVALKMEGESVSSQRAITFYDGSRYEGQFKDGELHGHGILTFPDGSRYEGEFRNGQMNGKGTMTFSSGSEYIGEFKDGALWGNGTITFPDGSLYEGQFKNDNYHGKGIWSSPFGIRYEGQFRNGKFDGQGIYSLPDGSRYIGYFKDDCFHGQGAWAVEGIPNDKTDLSQPNLKKTAVINNTDTPDELALPFDETGEPENVAKSLEDEATFSDDLAFSVQVGAFLSKNNAEKLAFLLRENGYNARLLLLNDYANRSWYTVRLGSYSSLEKAQEQAVAFSEKENMTATVRPVDSL